MENKNYTPAQITPIISINAMPFSPVLHNARMQLSEPTAPTLTVNDILTLNEADLVEYMKRNYGLDGSFDLSVEGWEKLARDKRDRLAETLR